MPLDNENHHNLSHHGIKEAEGFATRGLHDVNCVPCPEMPPGLVSMSPLGADPHRVGPQMPFRVEPSARQAPNQPPLGLLRANGPLNPNPHPANPWAGVKQPNTYGGVPVEKRR